MTRALLALALVLATAGRAGAQPGADNPSAETLRQAAGALGSGDYARAAELAQSLVTEAARIDAIDRVESYRVLGLALFYLERTAEAEAALLSYLRLDPDAHLDPGRYPPELIVFFEDIRARHKAELLGLRERPGSVREWSKNLFPPWGQFANGHRGKAWLITAFGVGLSALHLTSFLLLDNWCDRGTGVCKSGDTEVRKTAATLRWLNLGSGAALIGLYAYGVADGFYHHRRLTRSETPRHMSVGVTALPGGAAASVSLRF